MELVAEIRQLVQQAMDAAIGLLTHVPEVRGMIKAEVLTQEVLQLIMSLQGQHAKLPAWLSILALHNPFADPAHICDLHKSVLKPVQVCTVLDAKEALLKTLVQVQLKSTRTLYSYDKRRLNSIVDAWSKEARAFEAGKLQLSSACLCCLSCTSRQLAHALVLQMLWSKLSRQPRNAALTLQGQPLPTAKPMLVPQDRH